MSDASKIPTLVRRSVVELDLVGYSQVARMLEEHLDARVLMTLNEQVQSFVDAGLQAVSRSRDDVVRGTAGDNALLIFERADEAHRFGEAVHFATRQHNEDKINPAARRHFRIGISTGEIAIRGKEVSGTRIIDSVRLEAARTKGHMLIDDATFRELTKELQGCYVGPEIISDKQNRSYGVYRFAVIEAADVSVPAPAGSAERVRTSLQPEGISRITKYAPTELIGREVETAILNDAWTQAVRGQPKRPHILTFVALGGEGKTSLVAKWAAELAAQDWPGCDAAFAWSFYSQGTREQTAVSSDLFLAAALTFFGDAAMAGSAAGAFDKGRRLAQLVGARRALLILDGLEPLQYAPTSPTPGELKDQGLAALLKGLAATSHGLCVVTTRYALPDLRAFHGKTVREVELLRLSRAAGVQLLKAHGVTGSDRPNLPHTDDAGKKEMLSEFEALVEDVDGHALTLHLMGSFLKRAFQGDIRRRDRVTFAKADLKTDNGHAFRAMAAYEKWLADGSEEARRELALLSLMGLFDRPATADCLQALLKAPAIAGLTEPLVGLPEEDWNGSLTALQDARLLTVNRDAAGTLLSLDAHPLLREYFAQRLKDERRRMNPGVSPSSFILPTSAFCLAHRRLYAHLCATTKDQPDATLEDLQPLYQAVAHGCQAGLQQEACDKVYFARIARGNEAYAMRKLGAFGSDLGAVACFFEQPFRRVSPALTEADQAWLLNQAAFRLRALGRLTEALEPMRVSGEMDVKVKDWKGAAISYSNLRELELTLGEVAGAVGDAEQSVTYADRSGDADWENYIRTRTTHADALHQAGRRAEAEARFREAEQMQAERQPEYPLLYSLRGFQYCDLLLTEAERAAWQRVLELRASVLDCASPLALSGAASTPDAASTSGAESGRGLPHSKTLRDVRERAAQTLKWISDYAKDVLSPSLDHLTLGRAALYAAMLSSDTAALSSFSLPTSHLAQSVSGLRRAGDATRLPHALLTRAWQRSLTGVRTGPESAQSDLDEAWEIAARGPMPLFLADIHLHRARIFGGRGGVISDQSSVGRSIRGLRRSTTSPRRGG